MSQAQLEPGKYIARALEGKFTKSKTKGTPCVVVLFDVQVAPDKVVKMWWTGWWTEETKFRTIEQMAIAGLSENAVFSENNPEIPASMWKGFDCELDIREEEYTKSDGTKATSLKIAWVNKPGGSSFTELAPAEVKNMMAGIDLRKELAAANQKLGLKPAEKPAAKTANQLFNHAPGAKNTKASIDAPPVLDEPPPFN